MHTSFDYVRRSRYPSFALLSYRNILAECNYANESGGIGIDHNVQYGRVITVPGLARRAGSGDGLDSINGNYWTRGEGYHLAADLYLGPDFFCAYRSTRHSLLP